MGKSGTYMVVMHVPVPMTNNNAGVTWRDAVARSLLIGDSEASPSILVDGDGTQGTISALEKADIVDGVIIEHVAHFVLEQAGSSGSDVLAALDHFYDREKDHVLARKQNSLKYFGYAAD